MMRDPASASSTTVQCPLLSVQPGRCHWCGKKLIGRQRRLCGPKCGRAVVVEHRWTQAKAAAKRAARVAGQGWRCAVCGDVFRTVEVDHIVPCRGKHGVWGCWHHSSNLRVLCVPCHRQKTAADRERGWA